MATRWEVDVKTGEAVEIQLTPQEEADAAAMLAAEVAAASTPEAVRLAADAVEQAATKADAQIQSDLNITNAEIIQLVDVTLFSTWTAPQRTFMKRLIRMIIATARKVLR